MEYQLAQVLTLDLAEYVTATAYCAAKGISPPTLYRMLKKVIGPETVRHQQELSAVPPAPGVDGGGRAMTQPTTERDRVKQRFAKLLNMTLDKGASESEAMMTAEKAAELMAFYDIEASELSARSARAIKQTVSARKYGNTIIAAPVAHHIAQLPTLAW